MEKDTKLRGQQGRSELVFTLLLRADDFPGRRRGCSGGGGTPGGFGAQGRGSPLTRSAPAARSGRGRRGPRRGAGRGASRSPAASCSAPPPRGSSTAGKIWVNPPTSPKTPPLAKRPPKKNPKRGFSPRTHLARADPQQLQHLRDEAGEFVRLDVLQVPAKWGGGRGG